LRGAALYITLVEHGATVILEMAILNVIPGQENAFEAAFEQARKIIAQTTGFLGLTLDRCVEVRSRYLLLVRWSRLDDHTVGFRSSPQYQQWKSLLHHFYQPFPDVEHYESVFDA
jgi:heme-degrading monooxygenase HmoA